MRMSSTVDCDLVGGELHCSASTQHFEPHAEAYNFNKELLQVFGSDEAFESNGKESEQRVTSGKINRPESLAMEGVPSPFIMHERTESSSPTLSHVDESGKTKMVDVGSKDDTLRTAIAGARILLGREAFSLVVNNQLKKGDVLSVAQLAGIMGAKQTPQLIPLCHPLLLSHVDVSLNLDTTKQSVDVIATASTKGPTGVEMEAMTAAAVAALTVYDMTKAVSKDIEIESIRLLSKSGGKSGTWERK